jgi:NADH dehydrogenase
MTKILILGGSGFVGRHVCAKLAHIGAYVTVPTRRRSNAQAVQTLPLLDVVEADVHDPAQLKALVAGHDAVVNLVAILHGTPQAFERTHVTLMRSLIEACQSQGVKRVVHVSAMGVSEPASAAPSNYLQSKSAGDALLRASGLDWTILRPSVIFGADDKFLNLFARLQQVAPFMPLAGAHAKFQPVWVEDVAQAVVNALQHGHTKGKVFEACGPEVYTLAQLVQLAGNASGIPGGRPVIPLPQWAGQLQAMVMEHLPGEPLMSRDNLASMRVDNVATGLPGLQALGIQASALSAIAPGYLGRHHPLRRNDDLRSNTR